MFTSISSLLGHRPREVVAEELKVDRAPDYDNEPQVDFAFPPEPPREPPLWKRRRQRDDDAADVEINADDTEEDLERKRRKLKQEDGDSDGGSDSDDDDHGDGNFPYVYQIKSMPTAYYTFALSQDRAVLRLIQFLCKKTHRALHDVFNFPHYARQMLAAGSTPPDLVDLDNEQFIIFLNLNAGQFVVQRALFELRNHLQKHVPLVEILMHDVISTRFFQLVSHMYTQQAAMTGALFQHSKTRLLIRQDMLANFQWAAESFDDEMRDSKQIDDAATHIYFHRETVQLDPPLPGNTTSRLYVWRLPVMGSQRRLVEFFLFKSLFNTKAHATVPWTVAELEDRNHGTPHGLDLALTAVVGSTKTSLEQCYRECVRGWQTRVLLADLTMTMDAINSHMASKFPYRENLLESMGRNKETVLRRLVNRLLS